MQEMQFLNALLMLNYKAVINNVNIY